MIAIDTNVLVRTLVDDDQAPEQCGVARRLVADAGMVSISAIVYIETIWTLSRSFGYPRKQVVRVATLLLQHPKYRVQDSALFEVAVTRYATSNIDFSDAVALQHASGNGIELFTFDRKLARLHGARAV